MTRENYRLPDLDTILVADPSKLMRELLGSLLSPYGGKVLVTSTRESALSILRSDPVDQLICATQFEDGTGFEVAELARTRRIDSVLIARKWRAEEATRASRLCAMGYMALPLSLRELRACWKKSDLVFDELRSHRRRTLATAWISDVHDADAHLLAAEIYGVGLRSVFLVTHGPIPVGTELCFEMLLGSHLVRARGRVTRLQEPGWGRIGGVAVSLESVEPRSALEAFIQSDDSAA